MTGDGASAVVLEPWKAMSVTIINRIVRLMSQWAYLLTRHVCRVYSFYRTEHTKPPVVVGGCAQRDMNVDDIHKPEVFRPRAMVLRHIVWNKPN